MMNRLLQPAAAPLFSGEEVGYVGPPLTWNNGEMVAPGHVGTFIRESGDGNILVSSGKAPFGAVWSQFCPAVESLLVFGP
jgi:hypothetical protein